MFHGILCSRVFRKLHVEKQQILEENLKYKQEIQDLTARNRKLEARYTEQIFL